MSQNILIKKKSILQGRVHNLPSSKSISNRALIMDALSGNASVLSNLSEARDTRLMQTLVRSGEKTINALDAGTTMRFLTAYFAVTGQNKILTGTERMKERPLAPLVKALQSLGARIDYLGQDGFPPIELKGFADQKTTEVSLPGNISSQFVSALMMIGPALPLGLTIHLNGKVGSVPYIQMTASVMRAFGARCSFSHNRVEVATGGLKSTPFTIEPDWSAASYWFAFTALAEEGAILLPGLTRESIQGDSVITRLAPQLGVDCQWKAEGLLLSKTENTQQIGWDFTNCPDLAQTVIPVCSAKFIEGVFTGLESLRIKETDRIAALQAEIGKIGSKLEETRTGSWKIYHGKRLHTFDKLKINTYHDHRMAMGFAPWATQTDVEIENPIVVQKSYPGFWKDMEGLGFKASP